VKVRGRFTSVPKVSTAAAKHFRRVQMPPVRISSPPRNLARETKQHDGGEEQQRRRRDAAGSRAETSGAGAAATPATAPRGSVDIALPLRIPFRAEKQGKATKVPGRADGTRGKGKGVGNAATAASALSSTHDNTVQVADAMRRLAVQGTVQPVGGKGIAHHWTTGLAVVVSGGLGMPDVHGRPNASDIKAAGNCDHAHVRVVTASGVHFSRAQTIDVPSRRRRSPVSSRRGWQMQVSRLDGEAQNQACLSQHQRRARVRREAQEAALGHAGGGEQGRCFCRRRPATVKCACRTCVVRDRESLPSQPLCEPVNDGVICAAGDLCARGISAGEPTWGGHIS
jgi:hypothetical protein